MGCQDDFERTVQKVDEALAAGDTAWGLALAHSLVRDRPNDALALTTLGVAQFKSGSEKDSEASLRRAIALGPDQPDAHQWLANLLRTSGRPEEAWATLEDARRWPDQATTESLLGLTLLDLKEHRRAAGAFGRAATLEPSIAVHEHNHGLALERAGDLDAATEAFRRATRLAPSVAASHISLAQLLLRLNHRREAADAFRAAHRCEPNSLRGGLQLAQAQIEDREYEAAERLLRGLTNSEPRSEQALLLLGRLLQRLGRFKEAETNLRAALQRRPEKVRPYFDLVYGRKLTTTDAGLIEVMWQAREQTAPGDRALLDYALGKAYDDLGRYGEAMARYDAANAAMLDQQGGDAFDATAHTAYFDALIATFTPDFFLRNEGRGEPSERPVFVVGMIRSGTTLVDQILGSHPDVASIDEHPYWPRALRGVFGGGDAPGDDTLKALADGYLEAIEQVGGDRARVTNKLPTNYALLGPIHLAFPNARFVHIRRDPIDNLLSIYQTRFPNPVRYAHNRGNLVAYYREYRRLMAHWRTVIPSDRLLEIDYETLVTDREPTIRRMIDFLGLLWDDRCLRPEANPHEIRTPSAWQARQPIFTASVEKWRRYEPWLGEFAALRDDR